VFPLADESEVRRRKDEPRDLKAIGGPPTVVTSEHDWYEERLEVIDADIIVDALLGTGLSKPLTGLYKSIVETLDDFVGATIVSVDVPSGLQTNDSRVTGPAVEADLTVTFTALKPCLVLPPSHDFAGDVLVADIGNPHELLESGELNLHLLEPSLFPAARHIRESDTNKGDYGKVLVIGGSRGKSGAAAMSGQAALRAGAGLVTVATASSVLPSIAASMPELMTEALAETGDGTIARQDISGAQHGKTVLAIGPGLTTHPETAAFVRGLVRDTTIPIVIDADGLNAFVGHTDEIRGNGQARILTPHPEKWRD
jgi:NAD(P)H-hydrate epimerase